MVLIGSIFRPKQQIRKWGGTLSLLGLIQASSFGKPVTGTSVGVLSQDSQNTFVPFNPNDEGESVAECVVAMGLTGV